VAYAPAGPPALASAGDDGRVRLWDPATGQNHVTLPPRPPGGGILCLAFSPDGRFLVTGNRGGGVDLWEVGTQRQVDFLPLLRGPIRALTFTADGSSVLIAPQSQRRPGEPGLLVCWTLLDNDAEHIPWEGGIDALAFAPGGRAVAVADESRGVELWELGAVRRQTFLRSRNRVSALAFSPAPAGRLLAVAGGLLIECWDVAAVQRRAFCRGHRMTVHAVAFAPDGHALLSASGDRTVRLWATADGRERAAWDWQLGPVRAVAVAPDGMTAVACGDKPQLVVWDLDPE
jgi:WD40 repeat protein